MLLEFRELLILSHLHLYSTAVIHWSNFKLDPSVIQTCFITKIITTSWGFSFPCFYWTFGRTSVTWSLHAHTLSLLLYLDISPTITDFMRSISGMCLSLLFKPSSFWPSAFSSTGKPHFLPSSRLAVRLLIHFKYLLPNFNYIFTIALWLFLL